MVDIPFNKGLADRLREIAANKKTFHRVGLMEWSFKYIPGFFPMKSPPFHDELCGELDRLETVRSQKVLVIAPRGNAKSTWCSFARPLKAICEKTDTYIILMSDTGDQAKKYLSEIANELITNDSLREAYPLACEPGGVWNADRIETKNGVCLEAIGKGKNVRGRKFRGKRPSLIIIDDPQNDDDVISPNTREKDVAWINKAVIPAGDKFTNYFIIGTNLHRESIVGALSTRADFKVIKYSSIMVWPTHMNMWDAWEKLYVNGQREACIEYYRQNSAKMAEGAKVLWEEKENLFDLMVQRATMGHPAFQSEKQNDPRDPSKCEFKEEWFEDTWYDELPFANSGYLTVGYYDPAKGVDTKKHDYQAIITLRYNPELRCAFVEVDMEKRPVSVTIDKLIGIHALVKYLACGIETNGFQHLISQELIAKAPTFPVQPIENFGVHKNTRISRLSIWLERKFFRFKRNCPYTKILLQQLLDHPHAAHDDGSDALEGAVRVLTMNCDLSSALPNLMEDDGIPIGGNIFGD